MIPLDEILSHLSALVKVWLLIYLAGLPMVFLLPRPMDRRDILASAPLLGIAWWAAAIYIFPYPTGLWWAMAVSAMLFVLWRIWGPRKLRIFRVKRKLAGLIILVGCLSFLTPIFTQHVPSGQISSEHAANSLIISTAGGIPETDVPIDPSSSFNAANSGVPTIAAMAVMLGSSPISAMMAVQHAMMCGVILGLYLLMRMVSSRVPSAFMAIIGGWISNSSNAMFFTGELSSIAVFGVGMLAGRLFVDFCRHNKLAAIFPLSIVIGSIPMFNVLAAIGWAQSFLPVVLVAGMLCTRTKFQTFSAMIPLGAALLSLLYINFVVVKYENMEQVVQSADVAFGVSNAYMHWRIDASYIVNCIGLLVIVLLLVFLAVLLFKKRWLAACLILLFVACIVAGLEFWMRRSVSLFHPRQYLFWVLPVAFMTTLMGWHAIVHKLPASRRLAKLAVIILLAIGLAKNMAMFQYGAVEPQISQEAWDGLQWTVRNSVSGDKYFHVLGSAGRFIPAMASVPSWYVASKTASVDGGASRGLTYVFMDEKWADDATTARGMLSSSAANAASILKDNDSVIVFARGGVKIYRLIPKSDGDSPPTVTLPR